MESYSDTVAVITGGASGIGRGLALELARRGADVCVADVHDERLAATVTDLEALGRDAVGVRCDVTRDEDVESLRHTVVDRFGHVDLLVNNAGVSVLGPPERVEMDEWEWILQVNVLGIVRGVRAFVPQMLERGAGHVLNTSSIAGVWAYTWDAAPYITSKFAAYGLSEALARRLRPHGIGVSVLCPGLVATNLGETARFSGIPEGGQADWMYFPPELADAADPDEVGVLVADAVLEGRFAIFTHARDEEHYRSWRIDIDRSLDEIIGAQKTPPRFA